VSWLSLVSLWCSECGLGAGCLDELRGGKGSASSSNGSVSGATELFEWLCTSCGRLFDDSDRERSSLEALGNGENDAELYGDTSFSLKTEFGPFKAPASRTGIQLGSCTSGASD
jgi:hypothetical protein